MTTEADKSGLGDVFSGFFETDPTEASLRDVVEKKSAALTRAEREAQKARAEWDRAQEHLAHFLAGARAAENARKP